MIKVRFYKENDQIMSIIIPDTEDIEKLQKRFSEALGDEYQVEMYTEVSSSSFFSKKMFLIWLYLEIIFLL